MAIMLIWEVGNKGKVISVFDNQYVYRLRNEKIPVNNDHKDYKDYNAKLR